MKIKVHVMAVLVVLLVTTATNQAHSLSRINQLFSSITQDHVLQKSGPGPMCPPTIGCGATFMPEAQFLRARFSLLNGPGPMCLPTSGCGSRTIYESFRAKLLLANGPGPMCPPSTGCGKGNQISTIAEAYRFPLLADGTGPMCRPTTGCGNSTRYESFRDELLLANGPGPMCPPSTGCGQGNIITMKDALMVKDGLFEVRNKFMEKETPMNQYDSSENVSLSAKP